MSGPLPGDREPSRSAHGGTATQTPDPVMDAIRAAVAAVNGFLDLEQPLESAPETVIFGDDRFDSLAFVILATSVEESLQRTLGFTLSVVDLVTEAAGPCTIESLASRISEVVEDRGRTSG